MGVAITSLLDIQGMVHGKTFKASDTGMYFTSDQVFFKGRL